MSIPVYSTQKSPKFFRKIKSFTAVPVCEFFGFIRIHGRLAYGPAASLIKDYKRRDLSVKNALYHQ
jgi:hypothetical protein